MRESRSLDKDFGRWPQGALENKPQSQNSFFLKAKSLSLHQSINQSVNQGLWTSLQQLCVCSVHLLVSNSLRPHGLQHTITNSWSLFKLMSIELVMPSNHLILCRPLFLPPSIFPSIRVFSNESVLPIRWPKYWSFSFSITPSNNIQD